MGLLFFGGVGEEGGCLASFVGTIVGGCEGEGGCGWETAYRGGETGSNRRKAFGVEDRALDDAAEGKKWPRALLHTPAEEEDGRWE